MIQNRTYSNRIESEEEVLCCVQRSKEKRKEEKEKEGKTKKKIIGR